MSKQKGTAMKNLFAILLLLATLFAVTPAFARGQSADDCPPGSTDPDCKKGK